MASMFDYLRWRGDIPFTQVGITEVDSLIFSALSYMDFTGIVSDLPDEGITLAEAAAALLALPEPARRARVKWDLTLLQQAAETARFGPLRLTFYRDLLIPQEEIQFAAITFLLPQGSACVAFRGTDETLAGWKEDLNMSFLAIVPAQREALRYTQELAARFDGALTLCGHSKGGNLAVFAAATCGEALQQRITAIFNNDGPGFTQFSPAQAGLPAIAPKIRTFIPQSSIIGMLLERQEPYAVIKSSLVSLLQHELYSWEVLGGSYIHLEEISAGTRFADQTIRQWIDGLTLQERSQLVDALYALMTAGGADVTTDMLKPGYLRSFFKVLTGDKQMRSLLRTELFALLRTAIDLRARLDSKAAREEPPALPE